MHNPRPLASCRDDHIGLLSRRQFARCGDELRREGFEEEAELFSLRKPEVQLHDLGNYRCPPFVLSRIEVYVEMSKHGIFKGTSTSARSN